MVEPVTRLDRQFYLTMIRNWSPLPLAKLVADVMGQFVITNNALETTYGEEPP